MKRRRASKPTKTRAILVRVEDRQRERWARAANQARRGLSDWIRVTLDDASTEVR